MFQGGKMYYMILTNREKKNYFGDYGQGNKINKAKHLEIKDVLSYSCRSGITEKNWVIIKINDDGRKEIVALEQLEQEYPELIEEQRLDWLPHLSLQGELEMMQDALDAFRAGLR
jgi:hypothetical protein